MRSITDNEMRFLLTLLKSPEMEYHARGISSLVNITPMGALKIAKKLEKERLITSKQIGRAKIYKINFDNDYAQQYLQFLLQREAEQSNPIVKMWVNELRKIKHARLIILFGSVLRDKDANDIDVLLITEQKNFAVLKNEVEKINELNIKKLHPLYQSRDDFMSNIKKGDKVVLNAIKGSVVFGEEELIRLLKK